MKKAIKGVSFFLFLIYLATLLYLLFFSQYRQLIEGTRTYNLIPFETINRYMRSYDGFSLTDEFVGNILAFLPFGVFLPLLFPSLRRVYSVILGTFILSLSVECLQFYFWVGAFDVDDLLLNTVGGGLGYMFFLVLLKKVALNRGC
ncbi:VanZ family protein [Metabacillus sp. HB246100]